MQNRKRGNSEGSIYKMADGRWRGAVSLGWRVNENGKRLWKRHVITANTRHEVAEQLAATINDQNRGLNVAPAKQTVGDFLLDWLENTAKPSVRPKTYRSYEQMLRNHIVKEMPSAEWAKRGLDTVEGLGRLPLSKLDLQTMQRFFNCKLQAGNSPALVAYLRTVLRIALNVAVKADLVVRNVAALSTAPIVEKKEILPFTADEAGHFLNAAMGHRLEALFTAGLAIGLRSGECSALQWSDVDLENGEIRVRHTLQRKKGHGLVLLPPKSEKSRRKVALPEPCVATLRAHAERQEQERLMAGSRWKETGYVFTSSIGTPIDDRKILKEFNALVLAAQLPKQRFHDLRHACVSLLFAQDVDAKVIAEIVGHSDIRLTKNVYQHVYQQQKAAAASKMGTMLSKSREKAASAPVATSVATKTPVESVH